MQRIYLDNNSTTALDPQVAKVLLDEAMRPPANPSSVHFFGQKARGQLLGARQKTASFFGVLPEEVFFTSGGTESIHWMLSSLKKKGHLLTTAIEHSSVYKTVQALQKEGWDVEYLPCGLWGAPTPEQIEAAIRPNTSAMIFSACNAETGVKIDLDQIASIAEKHEIPLLIDAVACIGKEPFSLPKGVSALSLSGHKFHGPKGTGALIARSHFPLLPIFLGGAQEMQKRAGTENVPGIVALSEALTIVQEKGAEIQQKLLTLRSQIEEGLIRSIPNVQINGEGPRISNTVNVAFAGLEGESLLMHLDLAGVAVSHGSACSSGALEPSRVLMEMGVPRNLARSSIRISLSRFNTEEEVNRFLEITMNLVKKLRT